MSTKMASEAPIDPLVLSKMDDWGELFDCKAVLPASAGGSAPRDLDYLDATFSYASSVKNVLGLDSRSKKRILSLWFSQAVNGKSFLHPVTKEQVWYYSVHDSEAVKLSLELTTCFLMLLPALYQPYCSAKGGDANVMADPPLAHRIDDHVLTSLLLIGVVVQFVDIYLFFKSSTLDDLWSWRNLSAFDNHRFWMVARILTCIFIFIDALIYFADNRNPLFMRALMPVLFISRRENLQHLFEGTYFAIRKSWGIYRVVIMTIVIWSFAGFCLFNKLTPPNSAYLLVASSFETYWSSLATCFKCYLSRPSVLFNLKTYFHLNQGSALFFVTLTLVADIFGSSLIIATGTRHFRDFSLLCFKFKLRNRRRGLLAIFDILEDLQQRGNDEARSDQPATTTGQRLTCETWLAFCSSIRGKHFIAARDALTLYMLEAPLLEPISQLQFFRLCGALASRPKFKKDKSSFANLSALDDVVTRGSVSGNDSVHNPVAATLGRQTEERIAITRGDVAAAASDKDAEMSVLDIRKGLHAGYMQLRKLTKNAIKFSLTEAQRRWMVDSSDFLAHFGTKVEFGGSILGSLLLFLGVKTRLKFKPFSLLSLAMHGLLIYEMVEISSDEPPYSSVVMCWFLLLFFSFENFVHYLAGSEESQVTLQDTFVNALVFFAMCCMGVDAAGRIQNQTALTLFIVFQSLRSLKLFAVLKGAKALQSIGAILFRAFLLIGFAIYFFAIFGHSFFCSAFNVGKAARATDDAEAWTRFSAFLNFDSFLLSCYTLMQVVVISNWSIVMDAALEVFPIRGFVFFYFFKALMSLAVMPLMISLIIQTFITQLGIAEPPSIRQKLKVYRVSSSHQVTSGMVAMWSPNGREVVRSPPVDINQADLVELNRQIIAKLEEVATKKRFVDDALKGNAALLLRLRGDDHLSEIAASVDDIPAADFNLEAAKHASAQRTPAAGGLGLLDTSIQLQDLRILLEMQEWASLLTDATLRKIGAHERHVYAIVEKKYLTLERRHHADLAFLWFHDSIHARHIDLPKNRFSLTLYSIHRSKWFLNLCNVLVVLQITSTLFASSPCPRGPECFSAQDYLVQRVFAVLNLLIALFYGSETATNLYLGGQGGNWTKVRLSCCLFVTIDTLVFLSSTRSPQHGFLFSAAIFPLFWITRSNTFREVVMGLYSSLRKSAIVYNLLLAFLVMWSLLGFYLFHRYSTPLEHFKSFQSTVLTVLHCFTAAPYALDALQPLFPVSPAVVIYFLIITLSMEIVTVSLIVATSDMQFRLFAANNLKRRLSLRRDALLAIWALFARDERLSAEDWQFLCRGLKGDFRVDARSASLFFVFVTNNRGDGATQHEFFRLMALIHSRAVAAIASEGEDLPSRMSARHKPSEFEMSKIYANGGRPQRALRTIHIGINPKRATLLSPGALESGYFAVFRSLCQSLLFTDAFVVSHWRWKVLDVFSVAAHVLLVPQVSYVASFPSAAVLAWVQLGWFLEFLFWADMVVRVAALGELTFLRRESHVARAVINVLSLCLQLQLGYPFPADDGTTLRLLVLVQCLRLFLMFWFEQGASEISKIFKVAARCLFLLFSVIFFFTIYAQNSFCNFIQPDLVLSQMYVETGRGLELANDDSSAWVPFQDLLNFDTFLQSMFTLFQIAVLGSWSMIMDAAAKTDSVKAFGFFYPYRLAIILAVLPLLNGLVIRSYVLLMDQKDTSTSRQAEAQGGEGQGGGGGGGGEDDDDNGDLDDMVVNSDEATLSNRRISLHSRRGSRILEAQWKAQGSPKGRAQGGRAAPNGVAKRVWTGLKVAFFPSSAAAADEGLRAETTRIDRNSFLSFWATGSGAAGGESLLHNYEAIHLSHENVNAELGRLDEVIKRIAGAAAP